MKCDGVIRVWIKLVNWLLLLCGITVDGFAAYVAATSFSGFVFILLGFGTYVAFVGFVGIRGISGKSTCCVNFYSILFLVLIIAQTVVVIAFFANENGTIGVLKDLNSSGNNEHIKNWLDSHKTDLKIACTVALSIQAFTWILATTCTRRVAGLDEELNLDDLNTPMISRGKDDFGVSQTPQTDAARARLNEKYGGGFEKKTKNESSSRV